MKPILEIQGISKKFRIHHQHQPYLSLRDSIVSVFQNKSNQDNEDFWALKNVSFSVAKGESIGVIGKNGAGKSTLLKILSKITPPTEGKIIARGRIASLLEVGTGFHAELSGRENIFFNGSILGMKRKEIQAKFDEIVDFSGVERFLDTPLKHYSSGMQLRLAFAVAAFLEPEILLIDEVLAVGDAEFQRKCLGKMDEVSKDGRTVLFVSHNLSQVQSICETGVLLQDGKMQFTGNISKTIYQYLNDKQAKSTIDLKKFPRIGPRNNDLTLETLIINKGNPIYANESIELEIFFNAIKPVRELVVGFSISNITHSRLIECRSTSTFKELNVDGKNSMTVTFKPNLKNGTYMFSLGASCARGIIEYIPSVALFEILPVKNEYEEWKKPDIGIVVTQTSWTLSKGKNGY